MSYHAEVQHAIGAMALEMEGIGPHLDRIADDLASGVDYGHLLGARVIGVKHHAVESCWKIADTAMDLMGGFGIFKEAGFERLWRDARLGRMHPGNSALAHEFLAKTYLGINPDESPRWG
jgi:alkylation response protein AidB-like acyl-CoA dehydrogenase